MGFSSFFNNIQFSFFYSTEIETIRDSAKESGVRGGGGGIKVMGCSGRRVLVCIACNPRVAKSIL